MLETKASENESHRAHRPWQRHLPLRPEQPTAPPSGIKEPNPEGLSALTSRGVLEPDARQFLAADTFYDRELLVDSLECLDLEISRQPKGYWKNPAGFYIKKLRQHFAPPPTFQTRVKRQARQVEERRRREAQEEEIRLDQEYRNYCFQERERYIAAHSAELAALTSAQEKLLRTEKPLLEPWLADRQAEHKARYELGGQAPILSFEEFLKSKGQASATEPVTGSATAAPTDQAPQTIVPESAD